jgi:hypothetical protein
MNKLSVPIRLVHPQDDGIRPAGLPDECFYCNQKIGTPHLEGCVAVKKKVRLRFLVETEVDLPYGWSEQEISNYYASDNQHWFDHLDSATFVDRSAEIIDPGPNIEIRH